MRLIEKVLSNSNMKIEGNFESTLIIGSHIYDASTDNLVLGRTVVPKSKTIKSKKVLFKNKKHL